MPCSSDGTLRKTPTILTKWSTHTGLGLHNLQYRIAFRSAQMLAPGGTLVYSTCSLNPLENEAVVAALLAADPTLAVVASDACPALKRRPGLETWRVFDDGPTELGAAPLVAYASLDAVPEKRRSRFKASHFPPADGAVAGQLARCMRFLPHDDDTGGFFVTVLRKAPAAGVAADDVDVDVDAEPAAAAAAEPAAGAAAGAPAAEAGRIPLPAKGKLQEDLRFAPFSKVADVDSLEAFYGLEGFPWDLLVTRSSGDDGSKKILLVNAAARDLVLRAADSKLRVVHAGVIAFTRTSASAQGAVDYRLSQDGVDLLLPYLRKRKVAVGRADFATLAGGGAHPAAAFTPAVAAEIAVMETGSLVFYLDLGQSAPQNAPPPAVVAWIGAAGFVTVFAAKDDLSVLTAKLNACVVAAPDGAAAPGGAAAP